MTKTVRSLLALFFLGLGFVAFYVAANGGYRIISPTVSGIAGFVFVIIAGGLIGYQARIRR